MQSLQSIRSPFTVLAFLAIAAFASACDNDGPRPPQGDGGIQDGGDVDGDVDSSVNCPGQPPINGACEGELSCEYGTETCCGETFPSTVCHCSGGIWACLATDACYRPVDSCGDAGTDAGNDSGT